MMGSTAASTLRTIAVSLCIACTSSYRDKSAFLTTSSEIVSELRRSTFGRRRELSPLQGSSNGGGNSGGRKNLSASERARREEEKRRKERAGDVVIGKTSAMPGENNYAMDLKRTEEEWMRQASDVEQQVFRHTEKGMELLKMLRVEEAAEAFEKVFELRPNAYLWQAGIAKFYLGDLEGAADIFARCASTYESKFGEPASEERIWRHACELKLFNSMSRKDRKLVLETGGIDSLLTPIPEKENTNELLRSERRKVIRISRELFSASVEEDFPGVILSRAKLRSLGGTFDDPKPKIDRKMWKLISWYYLGLHYDTLGEYEESKKCMKMALRLCPSSGNGDDIIHTLPMLHMTRRNWFDDEDFEQTAFESRTADSKDASTLTPSIGTGANTDPVMVESIKSSLSKLKLADLQKALKVRQLHTTGSKDELQKRLFRSLIEDAGLVG